MAVRRRARCCCFAPAAPPLAAPPGCWRQAIHPRRLQSDRGNHVRLRPGARHSAVRGIAALRPRGDLERLGGAVCARLAMRKTTLTMALSGRVLRADGFKRRAACATAALSPDRDCAAMQLPAPCPLCCCHLCAVHWCLKEKSVLATAPCIILSTPQVAAGRQRAAAPAAVATSPQPNALQVSRKRRIFTQAGRAASRKAGRPLYNAPLPVGARALAPGRGRALEAWAALLPRSPGLGAPCGGSEARARGRVRFAAEK